MRRSVASVVTALVTGGAATVALALPAAAINTYNAQPAPERTEVGAFVALWDRDEDGTYDRFDWVCSGAMVDDDTFLTAAHCTDDWPAGTRFFVSLEEDVQSKLDAAVEDGLTPAEQAELFLDEGWIVEGDPHQDPSYPGNSADSHDIGVLDFYERDVTPQDVWDFEPATLPTEGQLDSLGSRALDAAQWWAVGYGTEEALRGPGGHQHLGGGVRMKAMEDFSALNNTWVRLAMNESRGLGGACYGDSGGPNFVVLDGEWVLAATTITGDVPCYATNVAYRMDTESARAFLEPFVDLP
ncbi:trypsin-like serine protease [Knoellia sp. p5-6-4]|uniref:trypsin-like serine protease n=1 Tax=unclassified Knoellia TaxID=2618719 RepID=UPI0023DB3D83|nr:trypsin-like serine protease [Knoellia sp. p5-6-4]MDF2144268.1 trypsin-like serine protease [Knoellia sp. p5-6-4]